MMDDIDPQALKQAVLDAKRDRMEHTIKLRNSTEPTDPAEWSAEARRLDERLDEARAAWREYAADLEDAERYGLE